MNEEPIRQAIRERRAFLAAIASVAGLAFSGTAPGIADLARFTAP
jgi:hypothetical protein